MKTEALVEKLKEGLGGTLRSVVLYGSAAGRDHHGKGSDVNLLVVVNELGLAQLRTLASLLKPWRRAGNPAPLIFTQDRLERSADVFPIEIFDIKAQHRILAGEDVIGGIEPRRDNLRLQVEHELKGKLIQLRARFLETGDRGRAVCDLLVQSLSSFLVLFRAALRLYEVEPPTAKREALQKLNEHIPFDVEVFDTVQALKDGQTKPRQVDADQLFERYLTSVEAVVDAVDRDLQAKSSTGGKSES